MHGTRSAPRLSYPGSESLGGICAAGFGRQLRLVPENDSPPAVSPTSPPPGEGVSEGPDCDPSLAAYLLGLSGGSPCFCCGTQLVRVASGAPTASGDGNMSRLECQSCGASLEGVSGE
jgi:hypothetical protein